MLEFKCFRCGKKLSLEEPQGFINRRLYCKKCLEKKGVEWVIW